MIKTITQQLYTHVAADVEDADRSINDWTALSWVIRHIEMRYMAAEVETKSGFTAVDPTAFTVRTFVLEWTFQNEPVYP